MTRPAVPHSGWERALLVALLQNGDVEEDLEDGDHPGAGDEFGMDSDRELDLGATCDIDQEQAWREPRSFVADGEVNESRANDDAAGGARRRAVA